MPKSTNNTKFKSGAVRGKESFNKFPHRFDLISHIGLRRLAETYGEGAIKYDENNWLKGIPVSNLMNHVLNHITKYLSGDTSEDHLAHASWNLFTAMHMEETKPDLMDLFYRKVDPMLTAKGLLDYSIKYSKRKLRRKK